MIRLTDVAIVLATLASCRSASIIAIPPRGCGTEVNKETMLRSRSYFPEARIDTRLWPRQTNSTNGTVELPFYFHIILAENNHTTDFITDELLAQQMNILNAGFAPMGYKFNLVRTIRTVNDTWYPRFGFYNATQYGPIETEMKTALRQGDKKALNTYVIGLPDTSISAWSTVPNSLGTPEWTQEAWVIDDGVVLHNSVLLNGSNTYGWNKGKSLAHEAGHWVGLYHTFSGGCEFNFDYVDDTPLEAVPAASVDALGGCPIGRDSCPDAPGLDPIHNFMDYTSDDCRTEFTPGQIAYAHSQMETYRQVSV